MKLKICGMKYLDNIKAVAELQPDYLGFIFYDKSARNFESTSIPELPNNIKKTAVFVNADIDFIIDKINRHNFQAVQLHGNESPEFCKALRSHYEFRSNSFSNEQVISSKEKDCHSHPWRDYNDKDLEIIKVFSINPDNYQDDFNFEVLIPFEDVVNYFLFDTKGKLPGGNGYTFDWTILKNYPSTKPFFLSGGIGLEQIEDIKKFKNSPASKYCYAIDVNSQFEIEPGLKNAELLKEFKKNVITRSETTK